MSLSRNGRSTLGRLAYFRGRCVPSHWQHLRILHRPQRSHRFCLWAHASNVWPSAPSTGLAGSAALINPKFES